VGVSGGWSRRRGINSHSGGYATESINPWEEGTKARGRRLRVYSPTLTEKIKGKAPASLKVRIADIPAAPWTGKGEEDRRSWEKTVTSDLFEKRGEIMASIHHVRKRKRGGASNTTGGKKWRGIRISKPKLLSEEEERSKPTLARQRKEERKSRDLQ